VGAVDDDHLYASQRRAREDHHREGLPDRRGANAALPARLCDHVVGYKAVLAKWTEGDYSERRSTIGWPPEFDVYVERSYAALKAKQTKTAAQRACGNAHHRLGSIASGTNLSWH